MDILAKIAFVAFVNESLVEYLFGNWLPQKQFLPWIAAAIGVVLCIGFNLDLFASIGIVSAVPYLGTVVTGLIISRGSDYLHQVYGKLSK